MFGAELAVLGGGFVFLAYHHVHGEDEQYTYKDQYDGKDLLAAPRLGKDVGVLGDDFFFSDGFADIFLERPDASQRADHKAREKGHGKRMVVIQEPMQSPRKGEQTDRATCRKDDHNEELVVNGAVVCDVAECFEDKSVLAEQQKDKRATDARKDHGDNRDTSAKEDECVGVGRGERDESHKYVGT